MRLVHTTRKRLTHLHFDCTRLYRACEHQQYAQFQAKALQSSARSLSRSRLELLLHWPKPVWNTFQQIQPSPTRLQPVWINRDYLRERQGAAPSTTFCFLTFFTTTSLL